MQGIEGSHVLASASMKAPPGMQSPGVDRVNVYLKTDEVGFRWFREDGKPTVVQSATIEGACKVAQLAWRNWELEIENQDR